MIKHRLDSDGCNCTLPSSHPSIPRKCAAEVGQKCPTWQWVEQPEDPYMGRSAEEIYNHIYEDLTDEEKVSPIGPSGLRRLEIRNRMARRGWARRSSHQLLDECAEVAHQIELETPMRTTPEYWAKLGKTIDDLRSKSRRLKSDIEGEKIAFESVFKEAKRLKIRVAELELIMSTNPPAINQSPSSFESYKELTILGKSKHAPAAEQRKLPHRVQLAGMACAEGKGSVREGLSQGKPQGAHTGALYNSHDDLPTLASLEKKMNPPNKNYGCPVCKKLFVNSQSVDSHMRDTKSCKSVSLRVCPVCEKTCANQKGVQNHLRMTACGQKMTKAYTSGKESQMPEPLGYNVFVPVKTDKVAIHEASVKRDISIANFRWTALQTAIRWSAVAAAVYHIV